MFPNSKQGSKSTYMHGEFVARALGAILDPQNGAGCLSGFWLMGYWWRTCVEEGYVLILEEDSVWDCCAFGERREGRGGEGRCLWMRCGGEYGSVSCWNHVVLFARSGLDIKCVRLVQDWLG